MMEEVEQSEVTQVSGVTEEAPPEVRRAERFLSVCRFFSNSSCIRLTASTVMSAVVMTTTGSWCDKLPAATGLKASV